MLKQLIKCFFIVGSEIPATTYLKIVTLVHSSIFYQYFIKYRKYVLRIRELILSVILSILAISTDFVKHTSFVNTENHCSVFGVF